MAKRRRRHIRPPKNMVGKEGARVPVKPDYSKYKAARAGAKPILPAQKQDEPTKIITPKPTVTEKPKPAETKVPEPLLQYDLAEPGDAFVTTMELMLDRLKSEQPGSLFYAATQVTSGGTRIPLSVEFLKLPEGLPADAKNQLNRGYVEYLNSTTCTPRTNIVRTYGMGKWSDDIRFTLNEAIDGPTLEDLVEEQDQAGFTIHPEVVSFIVDRVARALSVLTSRDEVSTKQSAHGALRADQILLSNQGVIKLGGVGKFLLDDDLYARDKIFDLNGDMRDVGRMFYWSLLNHTPIEYQQKFKKIPAPHLALPQIDEALSSLVLDLFKKKKPGPLDYYKKLERDYLYARGFGIDNRSFSVFLEIHDEYIVRGRSKTFCARQEFYNQFVLAVFKDIKSKDPTCNESKAKATAALNDYLDAIIKLKRVDNLAAQVAQSLSNSGKLELVNDLESAGSGGFGAVIEEFDRYRRALPFAVSDGCLLYIILPRAFRKGYYLHEDGLVDHNIFDNEMGEVSNLGQTCLPLRLSFVVDKELGRGGMGAVFKGTMSVGGIKTEVAIKQILPDFLKASKNALQAFNDEASLAAGIQHENVIKAYGLFKDFVTGGYFIAMDFVDGDDLENLVIYSKRAGVKMDIDVVLFIFDKMLQSIARYQKFTDIHGHEQCVVHRDIKPPNILVSMDGVPLLTDFGAAKIYEASATGEDLVDTVTKGTLDFMSPEQVAFSEVTVQADVFSLGMTTYFALTGVNPIARFLRGSQLVSPREMLKLLGELYTEKMDAIPDIRKFRKDIPDVVADIIMTAVQNKPEDRPTPGDLSRRVESEYLYAGRYGPTYDSLKAYMRMYRNYIKPGKKEELISKLNFYNRCLDVVTAQAKAGHVEEWRPSEDPVKFKKQITDFVHSIIEDPDKSRKYIAYLKKNPGDIAVDDRVFCHDTIGEIEGYARNMPYLVNEKGHFEFMK